MEIKVQSIHFDADKKLLDFIEAKIEKLEHYFNQIIRADIYLKLAHAIKEEDKVCEIRLSIPGNDLFCKEQAQSFEAATDMAIDCMKLQISKHKERIRDHVSKHKQQLEGEEF
jgi:putative sigma-54 modulation protein